MLTTGGAWRSIVTSYSVILQLHPKLVGITATGSGEDTMRS
jgi:hypothetical protein